MAFKIEVVLVRVLQLPNMTSAHESPTCQTANAVKNAASELLV